MIFKKTIFVAAAVVMLAGVVAFTAYEPSYAAVQKTNCLSSQKTVMKIAVTYENGQIFQHFGHTENFKIYETNNKQILDEKVIDTNGSGHGALAGMLRALGVEALICGGIGQGAKLALDDAGIKLYSGVSGDADKAVSELMEKMWQDAHNDTIGVILFFGRAHLKVRQTSN